MTGRTRALDRVRGAHLAVWLWAAGLASVAFAVLSSCSRQEPMDFTKLRVFFSTDAIGYLEPCG